MAVVIFSYRRLYLHSFSALVRVRGPRVRIRTTTYDDSACSWTRHRHRHACTSALPARFRSVWFHHATGDDA